MQLYHYGVILFNYIAQSCDCSILVLGSLQVKLGKGNSFATSVSVKLKLLEVLHCNNYEKCHQLSRSPAPRPNQNTAAYL
jgi:hypothetical protein